MQRRAMKRKDSLLTPCSLRLCGSVSFFLLHIPLLTSCRAPETHNWPFPEVPGEVRVAAQRGDAPRVLAVLRDRVERVESLYAELTMTIEGGERSGVFDTVLYYRAPQELRITAFRDLVVSTRDVFDLVLSEDAYVLRLDEDGEEQVYRGRASELSHQGFRVFGLLRARIFLPGLVVPGESAHVGAQDGVLEVTVTGASGRVVWGADSRTLGIRKATVKGLGGEVSAELEYLSYRRVHGAYLPERFRIVDVRSGITLSGWLRHVELNLELDSEIFEEPLEE